MSDGERNGPYRGTIRFSAKVHAEVLRLVAAKEQDERTVGKFSISDAVNELILRGMRARRRREKKEKE